MVDDSNIIFLNIQNMIKKELNGNGGQHTYLQHIELDYAKSGVDAMLKVANEPDKPVLILMDFEMDGFNGYETVIFLKRNPQYRNIPIVFCSSHAKPMSKIQGMALGAWAYLPKQNLSVESLFSLIRRSMGQ